MEYKNYIADSLYYRGENKHLTIRFSELHKPHEEINAEEIITDVMSSCGLSFAEEE